MSATALLLLASLAAGPIAARSSWADSAPPNASSDEPEPAPAPLSILPEPPLATASASASKLLLEAPAQLAERLRSDGRHQALIASTQRSAVSEQSRRAQKFLQSGQADSALRALALAYAVSADPQLLIELGRAAQQALLLQAALHFYERVNSSAPDSAGAPAASRAIAALRAQLGASATSLEPLIAAQSAEGARLFERGELAAAAECFALAYALEPTAVHLFNVAQCLRQSGQSALALAVYERLVRLAPATPVTEVAAAHSAHLDSELRAARRAKIERALLGSATAAACALSIGLGIALGLGSRAKDPPTNAGFVTVSF